MAKTAVDVTLADALAAFGTSVFGFGFASASDTVFVLRLCEVGASSLEAAVAALRELIVLFSGIDGGIESTIELRLLECALVREFNSCSPEPEVPNEWNDQMRKAIGSLQ